MLGILLIDKPYGITSHDVVNEIRRRFGTKRVGHAGTLDPLATGLLVVAVGPATRFLQYLPLEPKLYVGEITFGQSSDTYDREGKLSEEAALPADLEAAVREALTGFHGLISQVPPIYSAIKLNGKPLYRYAREGQEVHREPRTVHLSEFSLLSLSGNVGTFRIVCSGGTYVRSLAHDLGASLGCGAFLSELMREGVGRFSREMATPLAEITPSLLLPLREALAPMPMFQLDMAQTQAIREGRQVRLDCEPDNYLVALLEPSGQVFSVARLLGNALQPECVIPEEAVVDSL